MERIRGFLWGFEGFWGSIFKGLLHGQIHHFEMVDDAKRFLSSLSSLFEEENCLQGKTGLVARGGYEDLQNRMWIHAGCSCVVSFLCWWSTSGSLSLRY